MSLKKRPDKKDRNPPKKAFEKERNPSKGQKDRTLLHLTNPKRSASGHEAVNKAEFRMLRTACYIHKGQAPR